MNNNIQLNDIQKQAVLIQYKNVMGLPPCCFKAVKVLFHFKSVEISIVKTIGITFFFKRIEIITIFARMLNWVYSTPL